LWAFGRIDSNIAYADTDITVEEADLLRVKRQLLDQTSVAYARAQGAQQRLRVAEDNVAALDKLYQQIQRREQGRLASVADVRLALARLAQARAQLERFEGERAIALTDLQALTQIPVRVDPAVPEPMTRLPDVAEVEALAQERSADVILKTRLVALAEANSEREKTASLPTFYLQADRNFDQPSLSDSARVGVVLEGSLDGMGLAAVGRSKAAVARQRAAVEDLKTTRNEVRRAVNSLYTNRQLQGSLMDAQGRSVEVLKEVLASYHRQYAAGLKAWLDVLNMQRELAEQRLLQAQAENEWLIYSLKLVALTGGFDGLEERNEGGTPGYARDGAGASASRAQTEADASPLAMSGLDSLRRHH
jgi:adhesin transport system outer membrane protein